VVAYCDGNAKGVQLVQHRGLAPNFGDDLNAVLWPSLATDLIDDDPLEAFVGIGTLIGKDCAPGSKLHVFSSGVGYDPVEAWRTRDVTYWCVRGPLSCALLGLPAETAITDGAVLTPLADGFAEVQPEDGPTVIIPHVQTMTFPGWDQAAAWTGFELVDPRGTPRDVIARIAAAGRVLTESLHGAILADTYGVPWSVFATSDNFCSTKFVDWCESVEVPFHLTYVPPPNPQHILCYGRGSCIWGRDTLVTRQHALAEFSRRPSRSIGTGLGEGIKAQAKRSKVLQAMLRYSPARTAAALMRLAEGPVQLSEPRVRHRLQDRMMTRLAEVRQYARS